MILDLLPKLRNKKIVLASGSPRRRELLERLGLQFEVYVSKFAEDLDKSLFSDASEYNAATAQGKLIDTLNSFAAANRVADIIIACDTIVVPADNPREILEKASNADEAAQMLRRLSGKSHFVISTLVVHFTAPLRTEVRTVRTEVRFAALPDSVIEAYVAHEDAWRGKAGAYGIQDLGSTLIHGIVGDYYNVVGFPLFTFCEVVRDLLLLDESKPPA